MKTITIKILTLRKGEEILADLWQYIDSHVTEFSIIDAPDADRQRYGAKTKLVTMRALTEVDDDYVKGEFAAACAFLRGEYAGAFVAKEFNVNDPSPEDKIRFNALLPRGERRGHSCAEATK